MKQHISIKQLHEYIRPGGTWDATAIDKSFKALGLPDDKILTADLFTIGKMIEILEAKDEFLEIVRLAEGDRPYIVHLKSGFIYHADNLCDALWDAVKATL